MGLVLLCLVCTDPCGGGLHAALHSVGGHVVSCGWSSSSRVLLCSYSSPTDPYGAACSCPPNESVHLEFEF
jgi:hypothetical protein